MVRQMTYELRTGMIYEKAGTINHQVSEGNRETVYGYRMVIPGRGVDPALLMSFCRSTHRARPVLLYILLRTWFRIRVCALKY